jgi:hypothetical protein
MTAAIFLTWGGSLRAGGASLSVARAWALVGAAFVTHAAEAEAEEAEAPE